MVRLDGLRLRHEISGSAVGPGWIRIGRQTLEIRVSQIKPAGSQFLGNCSLLPEYTSLFRQRGKFTNRSRSGLLSFAPARDLHRDAGSRHSLDRWSPQGWSVMRKCERSGCWGRHVSELCRGVLCQWRFGRALPGHPDPRRRQGGVAAERHKWLPVLALTGAERPCANSHAARAVLSVAIPGEEVG
jgi:hypothetical protein